MTDQHRIDNMSEEEFYEHRRNTIKETFTEEDFLSCSITRARLQNEFIWEWEKNGVPKIEIIIMGYDAKHGKPLPRHYFTTKMVVFLQN